jgi:hypothetical protein
MYNDFAQALHCDEGLYIMLEHARENKKALKKALLESSSLSRVRDSLLSVSARQQCKTNQRAIDVKCAGPPASKQNSLPHERETRQ